MKISVVVTTFNRSDMLRQAVAAVLRQTLARDQFEIVIADNGSTDDTRAVAATLTSEAAPRVRYVYEPRPGVHRVRHAGARAAAGRIVSYIDDDCSPEPDWLANLARGYDEFSPDAAGGKLLIRWDRTPPPWVIPHEAVLGRLDHGPRPRLLAPDELINGGNFSILRQRLLEIGGFNPDQLGDRQVGDGESGLCHKIHAAGRKLLWVPDALVWHCQTVARNGSLRDLRRRYANVGAASAYAQYRARSWSRLYLLRRCAGSLALAAGRKQQALRHLLQRHQQYYDAELHGAMFQAEAEYFFKLVWNDEFRSFVARRDWISDA
jgi:glucosyl-dolichyl phosphate glucuronosyltransferase